MSHITIEQYHHIDEMMNGNTSPVVAGKLGCRITLMKPWRKKNPHFTIVMQRSIRNFALDSYP